MEFNRIVSVALLALLLLLPACAEQGHEVGGKLVIQAPEEARVSETVVITVTDESGRPVGGTQLYSPDYLGETDRSGKLATFFMQPASYDLLARRGKIGEPGFCEGRGTIKIVPGVVELVAFGGVHVGPPALPSQPAQTNNYRPGIPVKFRIKNIGAKEIISPNSAPWVIETRDGKMVFAPLALQVIVPLAPDATKEWTWDQKDTRSTSRKPGLSSCQSAKVRMGIELLSRLPGLVVVKGRRPPSCRQGCRSRSMVDGLTRQSWASTSAVIVVPPCFLRILNSSGRKGCSRLEHRRSVASQAILSA